MDYLKKEGIGSGIHYIPSHVFTYYQEYKTELPVTEAVYKRILTLPLYYDMSEEEMKKVIDKIKDFFNA